MVEPPERTMCLYSDGRTSMSAAWIVEKTSSAIPDPSTLIKWGWKSASGASNRSPPTLITRPSGSFIRNRIFWFLNMPWPQRLEGRIKGNLLCMIRLKRLFREPVFVPFQCYSQYNKVFLSTGEQFQSLPYDWMRSLSAATAIKRNITEFIPNYCGMDHWFYLDEISGYISSGNVETSG